MIELLLEKAVGQAVCCDSSVNDASVCDTAHSNLQHRAALAFSVRRSPMTTNGEMPMKMGISAPRVVISDYPADALLELRLRPEVDGCNSGTSSRPGVHPTIGLNGADITIKGQFYPTTRDDSEMTADAFSVLGGGVQRQRCKPIKRPPRVSKRDWRSHDTASGDLSGCLSRAENGGFDRVQVGPPLDFRFQAN
jgi:hypothetical protein